ncbi:hypothetical protein NQZ68_000409 [Dissostichus eleginoides]|nr:hypothetical protein NQZ68_000409 [Dissostichus eleginoides]
MAAAPRTTGEIRCPTMDKKQQFAAQQQHLTCPASQSSAIQNKQGHNSDRCAASLKPFLGLVTAYFLSHGFSTERAEGP